MFHNQVNKGSSRSRVLFLTFLVEGGVFVLSLVGAWYFRINILPLSENLLHDIVIGTIGAAPPFALFLLICSKYSSRLPILKSLNRQLMDIKDLFSNLRIIDLVIISLIAGVAEESLFRGVIQQKAGIYVASFLFGLVHFISPLYAFVTVIMGFYIGWIYHYSGNLLAPIQLHFVYDLSALLYLRNKDMNGSILPDFSKP